MGLKENRLSVDFCGIEFQNPIVLASGTCGNGIELSSVIDLEEIGGITTKTITLNKKLGNEGARISEEKCGMLNSIGLANEGLENFKSNILPFWKDIKNVRLIVSIGGSDVDEYIEICKELNNEKRIDLFELNVSCPNVKCGGISIGNDVRLLKRMITNIKNFVNKPIIIKLSPSFVDLKNLTKSIIEFGADAVSLVNTFLGTKIDIVKKEFYFKNKIAGYSGPSIKPLALKLICDVKGFNSDINLIGMGGISDYRYVLEFMIAGANLVGIGTMNFIIPDISVKIIKDLQKYCFDKNIFIRNLVNSLKR